MLNCLRFADVVSHPHFDHTGDPSTFPASTDLVVGPGFKDAMLPGWPANPDAVVRESDYEGRNLREISFSESLEIGGCRAVDYFGDGSFYLLDTPGVSSCVVFPLCRNLSVQRVLAPASKVCGIC